jgi:hypothetical protein
MTRSGCRRRSPANPVRGVRAASAVRSTRLAWGVFDLVTGEPGGYAAARRGADSRKAPRMKSSTMNGPQGLASESQRRRCQTAKNFVARGTRELASSAWGNRGPGESGTRKLWRGDPHIRDEARGVTPTSDVTAERAWKARGRRALLTWEGLRGSAGGSGLPRQGRDSKPGVWECAASRSRGPVKQAFERMSDRRIAARGDRVPAGSRASVGSIERW